MTRTRTIGTLAAIGGLTATIALLTGLPAANADELADLRANQELLQRRIDQLAQGALPETKASPGMPGALGAEPIPGQAIIGGSFPRSFLIPGTDTSIRVGGFVDLTANYFFQGANTENPGTPSSNFGQNGNLNGVPVGQQFVPGLGSVAQQANHSRGNGFFEFSPQQSRLNVETRTPTAWGESRTFMEFDWAGCNNFSAQTAQQAGGDSLVPRLRFAYGTLGGFLAGQAISNFSDADADTESMEFGGTMGSTGGLRIPQVRYTLAGPYGSAFSVSAEQPLVNVLTPAGHFTNDSNVGGLPGGPGAPTLTAQSATGSPVPAREPGPRQPRQSHRSQSHDRLLLGAALGACRLRRRTRSDEFNDGHFISREYLGYGGHFSGDVKPGWFGWAKDDFLFSFIAGEGIGDYTSGGWSNASAMSTNFTVATACATPQPGCTGGMAASNIIFSSRTLSGAQTAATSTGGCRTCARR